MQSSTRTTFSGPVADRRAAFEAEFRDYIRQVVIGSNPPPLDDTALEILRRTVGAAPAVADTSSVPAADAA